MGNRTRNKKLEVYLSEKEMMELTRKAGKTGLTKSTYIRKLIEDIQPKELPAADFLEVLRVLRKISINMNQVALKANQAGNIYAKEYWENSRRLREAISEIKRKMFEE